MRFCKFAASVDKTRLIQITQTPFELVSCEWNENKSNTQISCERWKKQKLFLSIRVFMSVSRVISMNFADYIVCFDIHLFEMLQLIFQMSPIWSGAHVTISALFYSPPIIPKTKPNRNGINISCRHRQSIVTSLSYILPVYQIVWICKRELKKK